MYFVSCYHRADSNDHTMRQVYTTKAAAEKRAKKCAETFPKVTVTFDDRPHTPLCDTYDASKVESEKAIAKIGRIKEIMEKSRETDASNGQYVMEPYEALDLIDAILN